MTTARRLIALFEEDRKRIQAEGRKGGSALRVHGISRELTGKRRNRVFVYDRYPALLGEEPADGAEPDRRGAG